MAKNTAQFHTAEASRSFMLAGNARVTLVSTKTGVRYTYKIQLGKGDAAPHFVALLTGADNESSYSFLGTIFGSVTYKHGGRSKIASDAPSALGFAWVWSRLVRGELPVGVEIWHEGRCGCCNRALTTPDSIARGIGPICAEMGQ